MPHRFSLTSDHYGNRRDGSQSTLGIIGSLMKKKNVTLLLCVDYRRLNEVTVENQFPLPRIDDRPDELGGSAWLSTLDIISGYWQVKVDPVDQPKTAFTISSGLYELVTMPFGLANAPTTFQPLMQRALQGITPYFCLFYLDDSIVQGRTTPEHVRTCEVF